MRRHRLDGIEFAVTEGRLLAAERFNAVPFFRSRHYDLPKPALRNQPRLCRSCQAVRSTETASRRTRIRAQDWLATVMRATQVPHKIMRN